VHWRRFIASALVLQTVVCPNCGAWVQAGPSHVLFNVRPPSDREPFERVIVLADGFLVHRCTVWSRQSN
jgi:hypothetical protein